MSSRDGDDPCGACERDDSHEAHENPAALDALDYRVGDYGRFLARMRDQLGGRPPDDPAVALIDAWACALDVLTFYQERIANEGFLRTARERRSVLELARAIGYELGPGVAASARLAFELLDSDKAPARLELRAGLRIKSVPGPGERPQTFETVEAILARPEWNAMRPIQREHPKLALGDELLELAGLSTGIKVGSKLLIVGSERGHEDPESNVWDFRAVVAVERDERAKVTRARLDEGLGWSGYGGRQIIEPPGRPRIWALTRRLDVFGRSAPDPRMFSSGMKTNLKTLLDGDEWANFRVAETEGGQRVHLVGAEGLAPGSWLVFEDQDYVELYRARVVEASGRTDYSLSLETTRVTLDTDVNLERFGPRTVTVHGFARELERGTRAIAAPIEGDAIRFAGELPLLEPGRAVIVSGPEPGADTSLERGERGLELRTEVALVADMRHVDGDTLLELESPLRRSYERSRTRVLANVARATHGKTVAGEVLGSGDGSKRFQSFALRHSPLTHVASRAGGIRSTLTVRVGGVAWTPVSSTHGCGPDDRVYVPRVDNEGVTNVSFGDGRHGARLPTGSENVSADYRAGLGRAGAVDAGQLSVLETRPQGVKAVHNPMAARGAEDPEALADARDNAPITVLTLGRLVSVADYEDFARAYPGIGKAEATRLWDGRRWWVHLSLATNEGAPLRPGEDLWRSLTGDIDARRDPVQRVRVGSFAPRSFALRARARVDPVHVAEDVLGALEGELRRAFAFRRRRFGQSATGSEILALAHAVPGVLALDLDAFHFADQPAPPADASVPERWILPARPARWDPERRAVVPAELLLIAEARAAVDLKETGP